MKKFFNVLFAAVLSLSLSSCGSKRESAQSVVENAIKAFQNADQEEMSKYWGDDSFTKAAEEETVSDSSSEEYGEELLKKLTGSLSYQIKESSEDADAGTASVTVEFTNMDMGKVVPEWIGDVFSKSLGYAFLPEDQQPSDEELNEIYQQSLDTVISNHADDKVTKTADIELSLVDDAWKINTTEEVMDAMTGGMFSSLSSLDDTFGNTEDQQSSETSRTNPADLGDYTVDIKTAVVTQDYEGNPAVVITYSWTNNSSDTTSPMASITSSVFQDGVGLQSAYVDDTSVYDQNMYMTDVRPGTTIDVQEAFALSNTSSPIEVEITEAFSWSEGETAYRQFDIAQ